MNPAGRAGVTAVLSAAAAAVAAWSAGTSSLPLAVLLGPKHEADRRAALLTLLGQVSAGHGSQTQLISAAREDSRFAPLDDVPFLVAGAVAQESGTSPRAQRLYEAALLRNPRSRGAHFMLAGQALAAGEAERALRHLASLARQSHGAEPELTKTLLAVVGDPRLDPALRGFLANEPVYREALFGVMANDATLANRLMELTPPRRDPPEWLPSLVETLVMAGRADQAAVAWTRFGGGRDPRFEPLRDARFGRASVGSPFGWHIPNGAAGTASKGADGLEVAVYGRESARLAAQWLMLAPGRYRLVTEASGGIRSALEWRLSCVVGNGPVFASSAVGTPLIFSISSACPVQALEMWTRANDSGAESDGKIAQVRLERLP